MTVDIDCSYISAACNRTQNSLDWGGADNQLIYAFSNSIALLTNTEPFQIKCTFNKHTDRVNCVKWIHIRNEIVKRSEFISGSTDKSLCVWHGSGLNFEVVDELKDHTGAINVVDGFYYGNEETLIASASADSTVKFWYRSQYNEKFKLLQTFQCKSKGFALALKFTLLTTVELPALFVGYENHKIEINVLMDSGNTQQFHHMHTLMGHEDWIRDIDICKSNSDELTIASCSQDCYIRLWKVVGSETTAIVEQNILVNGEEVDEQDEDDDEENEPIVSEIKLKSTRFYLSLNNKQYEFSMSLESVLYGHEDTIYSIKWHPFDFKSNKQPLMLLSASLDKSIVLWKYDLDNSVWLDIIRAGDIGGNTLGFYGACFDPNENYIVAHGFQGALHAWLRVKSEIENEKLQPVVINSGHFGLVEDLCWEPSNEYFLSVSKDQTTRFHAKWLKTNTWHEFGRPQVHGYDMQCVAFLNRFTFVSGADEKILRVFEAPTLFLKNYFYLSNDKTILDLINNENLAEGASVPALGLSNKAVFDVNKQKDENTDEKIRIVEELYKDIYFNNVELNQPPTEEHLLQNTLWPEIQKLYGHGFEIFSCAVNPDGNIIASASKATKTEHASIILWNIKDDNNNKRTYRQLSVLPAHDLTIVQMEFSHNGKYLLSVSRDRSWKLFRINKENNFEVIRGLTPKNTYHTRIIWSCAWSHDDKYFITTSRDKRICIWPSEKDENVKEEHVHMFELNESITACSFGPVLIKNSKEYLIAVGLESGEIELLLWNSNDGFRRYACTPKQYSHHLTIKRLRFCYKYENNNNSFVFQLASCSDDTSVRLFTIKVNN